MNTDLTTTNGAMMEAGQVANQFAGHGVFARYRAGRSQNTLRNQDASLALFADYLQAVGVPVHNGDLADRPEAWQGVTWGLIAGFVEWLTRQGYSVGSVNVRLSHVRTYAGLAAKAGAIADTEAGMIRTVTGYSYSEGVNLDEQRDVTRRGSKKAEANTLTRDQVRRLKRQPETPQGRRDGLLVCLLVDHGLRVSEVAALQVSDFDLDAGLMTFYRPKTKRTQTHELTLDTLRALRAYIEAGDIPAMGPLMRASAGSHRLTHAGVSVRNLSERIRTLGRDLGIADLSSHDLRHTWATRAARNGTALDRLQDGGGWTSPAMPMRYIEAAAIANEGVKLD